jgi:hypothetical protein
MKGILMKKMFSIAAGLLFAVSLAAAQTALNNDAIVKMSTAGLSDDVIVATMMASAGNYNTTPDSLIALKKAGVSNKVIAELVLRGQSSAATTDDPITPPVVQQSAATPPPPHVAQAKPRVYLSAQNSADTWGPQLHDQAQEMTKDFGQACLNVIVTVNKQMADYTVSLNHVEARLYHANQLSVGDHNGDVIAPPVKNESISKGVNRACEAITSDWAAKYTSNVNP